jgi:xanthine dehydrogenase YagR molybdenum-binding subunit
VCAAVSWSRLSRGQFVGGIVRGISLALLEDTAFDWRYGRITNANLADYHVPFNADIPEIDVDIPDYQLNSVGARGIGEIGITGTAAAICNAIFHATGHPRPDGCPTSWCDGL